jgi:hypothetical protein
MAVKRYNSTTAQWESFGSPQLNPGSLGITPDAIGAVAKVNGAMTSTNTATSGVRNMTLSTSAPTAGQGSDGDVWMQYV